MKRCNKCGIEKAINEFHQDKAQRDGHRLICKECAAKDNKEYYSGNKDKILKQQKEYHRENRDRILKQKKEYDRLHREEYKQYRKLHKEEKKEYNKFHQEEIKESNRRYSKTEKGKLADIRKKHNRRALYKKERSDITPARWAKILQSQNSKCNICHKKFTLKRLATQDHIIPISKGGSLKSHNIQALCRSCNSKKNAKFDNMYIQTWVHNDNKWSGGNTDV